MVNRSKLIGSTAIVVLVAAISTPAAQAAAEAGQRCPKVGATSGSLVCVNTAKSGKRPLLKWQKAVAPSTTAATTAATTATTAPTVVAPGELTIYSGRTYGVEPVFARYEKETGVKLTVVTASDTANRDRMRAEGSRTAADVYLTTDVGALTLAEEQELLAPLESTILRSAIPVGLRSETNSWFALSKRARVLFVNTSKVSAADFPTTYNDMANPKWAGRLCLRPSSHVYTQSLAAHQIALNGVSKASEWLEKVAKNAKRENFIDSDTKILETLNAGGCDAAIANTYYFGRLGANIPNVKMIFPDQRDDQRGAHINLSGAGVVAASSDKALAQKFIEWLATQGQADYANTNFEFPANPSITPRSEVSAWGKFKADEGRVLVYSKLQPTAAIVLTEAGWK
jgi:iron(III) transport system substrate-binding protein